MLLCAGAPLIVWSVRSLSAQRLLGKELFLSKSESTLVTTGAYAWTRNPLYLAYMLLIPGGFLVLRLAPAGFAVVLFTAHFLVTAAWEARELRARFGPEYEAYCKRVPFLIPRPWRRRAAK